MKQLKQLKEFVEYAMIVLRAAGVYVLYGALLVGANENVDTTLQSLAIPGKTPFMFLFVKLICTYVGVLVLWNLILQRSVLRKRRLAGLLSPTQSYLEHGKDVFKFPFFWIESLSILLPCAVLPPVRANIMSLLGSTSDNFFLQYLLTVGVYVIPLLLAFSHFEIQIRRVWAEEWYYLDEGVLRRFREGIVSEKNYYGRLVLNLVLYYFGMVMFPMALTYLLGMLKAFSVFGQILPQVIGVVVAILLVWLALRLWGNHRRRKKFVKQMQEVCDKYKFQFSYHFSAKGLLFCTGKTEFAVKTEKNIYAGCLLPVAKRYSNLYFSPYEDSYRFGMKLFGGFFISYPRHKVDISKIEVSDEKAKKVLLLTRRPAKWCLGTHLGGVNLDNGSVLNSKGGSIVLYDMEGLIAEVDIEGIRCSRTIWQ